MPINALFLLKVFCIASQAIDRYKKIVYLVVMCIEFVHFLGSEIGKWFCGDKRTMVLIGFYQRTGLCFFIVI